MEERSIFDAVALTEVVGLDGTRASVLWQQLLFGQTAEFYARHQGREAWQLALEVGPSIPDQALLRGAPLGVLSRVIRVDGGADSGGLKLLSVLPDGRRLETAVVLSDRRGRGLASATICVSSQAGCAMGCRFCDTGLLGTPTTRKNALIGLPSWAILEQVLHAEALLYREGFSYPSRGSGGRSGVGSEDSIGPANVVFMGMGEPLLNYRSVLSAVKSLCGHGHMRRRRVTLSTVGVSPRIAELGRDAPPGLRLALSLHAPTQDLREQLLPHAARAWPLPELLRVIRDFEAATDSGVLLEYILLHGLNDEEGHADALAELIRREELRCAGVNLIPYNPTIAGMAAGFKVPTDARCKAFRARLRSAGVPNVTLRFSTKPGRGLAAACGQLGLRNPV